MFNQIFHNQTSQRVRYEAQMLKDLWKNDPHRRTLLKNSDPDLAAALEANNDNKIQKISPFWNYIFEKHK